MIARLSQRVAAVVLACSHLDTLPLVIAGLRAQTYRPDEIIVVYQGSDEDVAVWLEEQSDVVVLKQKNLGSAGGFCTGIAESIRRENLWTWIFDDDGVPDTKALEELVSRPYFGRAETVFMASRVIDRYGRTYMSPRAADANRWYATVLDDECVEVVAAAWLGLLVSSLAVQRYGLPIAEFFFYDEDAEFSERLARNGKAYCAIRSMVVHYQDGNFDPFKKDFFKYAHLVRNRIGRSKLQPGIVPLRLLRTFRSAASFFWAVLKGEAPLRVVPWILHGMFLFWPRVRYLSDDTKLD